MVIALPDDFSQEMEVCFHNEKSRNFVQFFKFFKFF